MTERERERLGHGWLVGGGVSLINVAVLALSDVEVRSNETLRDLLVPSGGRIDDHEYWRPLTSLVAHDDPAHLAINTALLAAVIPFASRELGPGRSMVTYLSGGMVANMLRYVAGGRSGGGASGAILAVGAAAAAAGLSRDRRMPATVVSLALTASGLLLARRFSDNHVLALGVGSGLALATTADGVSRVRFAAVTGSAAAVATALMVARAISA